MIYSEQLQHNKRMLDFYRHLIELSPLDYSRAQYHCKHFLGGFVRGIYFDNGTVYFKLES